jgi:serine protease Do
VAAAVTPAVVTVISRRRLEGDDNGLFQRFFGGEHPSVQGHGSGFILQENGTILTNSHVVEDAEELVVRLSDGQEYNATVVGRDSHTDIALIHVQAASLPVVQLGDSDDVRVGEWVLAIGSPFRASLGSTVTTGIISGKGRDDVNVTDYEDFLQTDAAVNPGNSGGPLVNLRGQVIGINTAIATQNGSSQGVSFAIPINLARDIATRLLHDGHVTRAWLGVDVEAVPTEAARAAGMPHPAGVRVGSVYAGSPAARAGLLAGDIIVALDGQPLEKVSSFRNRIALFRPGQRVELLLLREGATQSLHAVLAELTEEMREELGRRPRPRPRPTP